MKNSRKRNARVVLIRDDDTNALTPPDCLEELYRPLLDDGKPVNLAVIPEVNTQGKNARGELEGYIRAGWEPGADLLPLHANEALIGFLHQNDSFHVVQHGCHHDPNEFQSDGRMEVRRKIERGLECLELAGFTGVETFVAPYDRLSRTAFREASKRFRIISTGWFEWRRIPWSWMVRYGMVKAAGLSQWRIGNTLLLSHPGCLLRPDRKPDELLDLIKRTVMNRPLTVLVNHWWEYFVVEKEQTKRVNLFHKVIKFLSDHPLIELKRFEDL